MRVIFKKIKIHPFFYLLILTAFITGLIKELTLFMYLIITHELGHIIGSLIYKWEIEKIIILPFGGLTIFNQKTNSPLKEEFVVLILGPIFQIVFYYLYIFIFKFSYPLYDYHMGLLLFNLLPIIPLDGSKFISIIANSFLPFKKSHIVTIYLSIISLMILLFIDKSLIFLIIMLFILNKVIVEYRNHDALFNKFLFERYIYNFNFKKRKTIKKIKDMSKGYYHFFKIKNKYLTEKEILNERFKKNNHWLF